MTRSHSTPHVRNDDPISEAALKTLKYCPSFPERFGCIEHARAFCDEFFNYDNHVRRHSGIALRTPASVDYGTHVEIREQRRATLSAAFEANLIPFGRRPPQAPTIPEVVWINPPIKDVLAKIESRLSVSSDLTGSGRTGVGDCLVDHATDNPNWWLDVCRSRWYFSSSTVCLESWNNS